MNYDQVIELPSTFNWATASIQALLYEGAEFDPSDQRASDIGVQWLKREPLQGRFVTDEGLWAGLPALFYMVVPDKEYQLVLAWDDGRHDEVLLAFFDRNVGDVPISVERRGSLFVRPAIEQEDTPPTYGLWVQPGPA